MSSTTNPRKDFGCPVWGHLRATWYEAQKCSGFRVQEWVWVYSRYKKEGLCSSFTVSVPSSAALSLPRCPWASLSHRLRRFSILGGPVLSKSVSLLIGRLLHEELALRWEQLLLDEAFTGGALAWLPGRTARTGQLVFPSGGALDKLCILSYLVGILRPSTDWSRAGMRWVSRLHSSP